MDHAIFIGGLAQPIVVTGRYAEILAEIDEAVADDRWAEFSPADTPEETVSLRPRLVLCVISGVKRRTLAVATELGPSGRPV